MTLALVLLNLRKCWGWHLLSCSFPCPSVGDETCSPILALRYIYINIYSILRRDFFFCARFASFCANSLSSYLFFRFFVLFHSCCSHSLVFGKTFVHEFHISYTVLARRIVVTRLDARFATHVSKVKGRLGNLTNTSISLFRNDSTIKTYFTVIIIICTICAIFFIKNILHFI